MPVEDVEGGVGGWWESRVRDGGGCDGAGGGEIGEEEGGVWDEVGEGDADEGAAAAEF